MADRPAPESCECKVVGSFDRGTGRNCYDRDPSACRYPETLEALRKAEEERDFLAMLRAGDISLVAAVTQERDRLREALRHAMACDFPMEIDFRCEGCESARAALQPPAVDAGERHCGHSSHDFDPDVMRFECCSGRSCVCKCKPASGGGGEK